MLWMVDVVTQSLSSRRAWIEMKRAALERQGWRRSPHGERGLKCRGRGGLQDRPGRSPHGERGLKLDVIEPVHGGVGGTPKG